MSSKGTILVIASSIDSFTLSDGREEPIGYFQHDRVLKIIQTIAPQMTG